MNWFAELLRNLFKPKPKPVTPVATSPTPPPVVNPPPIEPTPPPIVTVPEILRPKWFPPIRLDKFVVTQAFLNYDPVLYKITKHHPGVDYGTQGADNVPIFFCTDGEIIESGFHAVFGNYFFFYVASVDRTFVYFHIRDTAPPKGQYKAGTQCGIAGTTGTASTAIHLHIECMKGRKTLANRQALYTSEFALMSAAEDANAFLKALLA